MTMSMLPFVEGKWSSCAFLFRSVTPLCSCRSSGSVLPFRKDTDGRGVGVTRQIIPASAFKTAARSYYDVLNVSPSATQEQIKKSYIKLSKKYHPDINNTKEAKEIFQNISEAYSVLSNINLRNTYNVQNGHVLYRERPRTYPGHARGARPPPPTGRSSYYNYDEFYRQHYAGYNRQTYERRTGVNLFTKQKLSPNEQRIKRFQIGCITTALSLSVLFMYLTEHYKQKRLRNIEESRKRYRYKRNREE